MFKLTIHPPERVDGTLTRDYTFATQDDSRSATFAAPPCCVRRAEARAILLEALDALNFDPNVDVAEALGITSDKRRHWVTVAYAIESVVRPTSEYAGALHGGNKCPRCGSADARVAANTPAQVTIIADEPTPEAPSTRELADRLAALTSRVDSLAAALSPATTDAQFDAAK